MKYRTAEDIESLLLDEQETIVNKIDPEKIDVYLFLHDLFKKTDVTTNRVFQFAFRHFYKLDNPSLTQEFQDRYFEIMEQQRNDKHSSIVNVVTELYEIKNHKGNPTMQFPLATAMLHTLNPNFPTYDSDVAKAFDFSSTYHLNGFYKKMKRYVDQYQHTFDTYKILMERESLAPMFDHFETRFPRNGLSKVKKMDLMVAELGKQLS
ncbi:hypothetical protein [Thalassobacillus pellis]|uniref:hypothetical protein n=1 Tax=Thalassobacillus pellis TaxID=748008 RepID=UPI00195F6E03|nr:hypothetical protein [Thalassobacillus pellis]MBM7551727.1 hypothetical protein [Thalassobacillus pellis]